MSSRIFLTVTPVRASDYKNSELPATIVPAFSFALDLERLGSLTEPELKTLVKRHLLSKSIHKGKFLGFRVGQQLLPTLVGHAEMLRSSNMSEIPVVIEYEDQEYNQLHDVVLTKLEELKSRVVPAEVIDRLALDLAWSSDAIEGTTVERQEAQKLLDPNPDVVGEDKLEMFNHLQVIKRFLLGRGGSNLLAINEAFIQSLHMGLDIVHLPPQDKGTYRQVNVTIRGVLNPGFADHEEVPARCDHMFRELHTMGQEDTVSLASWIHYHFVQIHPFRDGNGRVARLLMNTVLLQRGFPLSSIQPGIREIYYYAIRRIRVAGDWNIMKRIVLEAVLRSVDIMLFYSAAN